MTTANLPEKVSDIFDPQRWRVVEGFEDFTDITYHRQVERNEAGEILRDLPCVRIAFNRPEVRNAFRPGTVDELYRAMDHARMTSDVGTVLLTGNGPSPKDSRPRTLTWPSASSLSASASRWARASMQACSSPLKLVKTSCAC